MEMETKRVETEAMDNGVGSVANNSAIQRWQERTTVGICIASNHNKMLKQLQQEGKRFVSSLLSTTVVAVITLPPHLMPKPRRYNTLPIDTVPEPTQPKIEGPLLCSPFFFPFC